MAKIVRLAVLALLGACGFVGPADVGPPAGDDMNRPGVTVIGKDRRVSGQGIAVASLLLSPSPVSMNDNATQQMTATAHYVDGSSAVVTGNCSWTTSDAAKATISSSGLLTGVAAGSATITATFQGAARTASLTVISTQAPVVTSYNPGRGEVSTAVTITGDRFTGTTAVSFNGIAASFIVVNDETISATVPNAATTGPISVTNAYGTTAGPSFTVDANTFAFDLTTLTVPTGLTLTRTGATAYAQRSATTVAAAEGAAIVEDFGDGNGGGTWTFPAYYNPAPPFDFRDSAGWAYLSTPTVTINDATAPDGTVTADKIADTSAVATQGLAIAGSTAPGNDLWSVASVWVKDASPAPSAAGCVAALYDQGSLNYGTTLSSGNTWRRVNAAWFKSGGSTSFEYIGIYPAGAAPVANSATINYTTSATGAVHAWGASATRGYALLPLISGTTSASTIAADTPANVLAVNGDLHIEGEYLMDPISSGAPSTADYWRLFHVSATGGDHYITFGQQLIMNGTFRGVGPGITGASRNVGIQTQGKGFRWEFWYRPSSNDFGMQFWVNGMRESNATYRNTGTSAIGTVTAAYLGHNNGTSIFPRRHTMWRKTSRSLDACEGVLLGDSIVSTYSADPSAATYIYTSSEARNRDGIVSYAYPGQTINQQTTAWQGSAQRGAVGVAWVWIHAGINDLNTGGDSAATATSDLQALINDINTQNPSAKVIVAPVFPCKSAVGATVWAKAETYNSNIAGTGPNPITGSNLIRLAYWTAADDGSGNLIAAYDSGDGIHENTAGRQYIAGLVRAALVANNLL